MVLSDGRITITGQKKNAPLLGKLPGSLSSCKAVASPTSGAITHTQDHWHPQHLPLRVDDPPGGQDMEMSCFYTRTPSTSPPANPTLPPHPFTLLQLSAPHSRMLHISLRFQAQVIPRPAAKRDDTTTSSRDICLVTETRCKEDEFGYCVNGGERWRSEREEKEGERCLCVLARTLRPRSMLRSKKREAGVVAGRGTEAHSDRINFFRKQSADGRWVLAGNTPAIGAKPPTPATAHPPVHQWRAASSSIPAAPTQLSFFLPAPFPQPPFNGSRTPSPRRIQDNLMYATGEGLSCAGTDSQMRSTAVGSSTWVSIPRYPHPHPGFDVVSHSTTPAPANLTSPHPSSRGSLPFSSPSTTFSPSYTSRTLLICLGSQESRPGDTPRNKMKRRRRASSGKRVSGKGGRMLMQHWRSMVEEEGRCGVSVIARDGCPCYEQAGDDEAGVDVEDTLAGILVFEVMADAEQRRRDGVTFREDSSTSFVMRRSCVGHEIARRRVAAAVHLSSTPEHAATTVDEGDARVRVWVWTTVRRGKGRRGLKHQRRRGGYRLDWIRTGRENSGREWGVEGASERAGEGERYGSVDGYLTVKAVQLTLRWDSGGGGAVSSYPPDDEGERSSSSSTMTKARRKRREEKLRDILTHRPPSVARLWSSQMGLLSRGRWGTEGIGSASKLWLQFKQFVQSKIEGLKYGTMGDPVSWLELDSSIVGRPGSAPKSVSLRLVLVVRRRSRPMPKV
ncbi:hypothetical protein R3P38DRAFT_2813504 [Favolaschia claudopus]|uniref:Uncharacterized protein n=1 Tax=Favolaschia claudopus TaxID=2862362 RepID=A0AAV9Z5X7_9AGAR